jgi:hypothetical protein
MAFHQDRKYLNLKEGESRTYYIFSLPKNQVKFKVTPISESAEKFYFVYSPALKDMVTYDTNYYKQIFKRENNKLNMESVNSSLEEFVREVKV